jgi:hypothetical protein
MDVAFFVGFAASGPLHIPVAIEDMAEFEAVFGGGLPESALPLAWDTEQETQIYAYLTPTVRAFFRNGGRRCWIVRVAGDHAATARFPVPGLAEISNGQLKPGFAAARSPGSWADSLQVSSSLLSQGIKVTAFDPLTNTLEIALTVPGQVGMGDLLRLTYAEAGYILFFFISQIEPSAGDPDSPALGTARQVRAHSDGVFWFRPPERKMPSTGYASLTAFDPKGETGRAEVTIPGFFASPPDESAWPQEPEGRVRLDCLAPLPGNLEAIITPGALVRVDFDLDAQGNSEEFWLLVLEKNVAQSSGGSPLDSQFLPQIVGQGLWYLPTAPAMSAWSPAGDPLPDFAEKLTFELWVRQGDKSLQRMTDLGFTSPNPRYWGALPADEPLYTRQANLHSHDFSFTGDATAAGTQYGGTSVLSGNPYAGLWHTAQTPRFPLSGAEEAKARSIPLAIPPIPMPFAGKLDQPGSPLERDGLDQFSAALFLDPDLAGKGSETLLGEADFLRYLSDTPRRLRGIHAALGVEEAALLAVPDAVHLGWFLPDVPEPPPPFPAQPLARPEWWACDQPLPLPLVEHPAWDKFLRCSVRVIAAPTLANTEPDSNGNFSLTWVPEQLADRYIVEESAFPDFSNAGVIFCGPQTCLDLYGYPRGHHYFQVRAELLRAEGGFDSSDWSNRIVVSIMPGGNWQTRLTQEDEATSADQLYQDGALRAVHRSLLRLCAARGDLFAVLALPGHFREREARDYVLDLRSPLATAVTEEMPVFDGIMPTGVLRAVSIPPLGYGEARSLSFGAVYHPWFIGGDAGPENLHRTPPDGPICGMMAQRAFERGAWIAPANQPLRGMVALAPPIQPVYWLDLQETLINLVRREPNGFVCLNEDTLHDSPEWRSINVRRLISLLRRLAQRYGPSLVFEPNSPAFQRLVKRTFEGLLDQMFVRGAFAGSSPATSYQVNVIATPQDIDEGRFIVELRVAPSLPMRFLTVRLVQSGEHSLVTEGG